MVDAHFTQQSPAGDVGLFMLQSPILRKLKPAIRFGLTVTCLRSKRGAGSPARSRSLLLTVHAETAHAPDHQALLIPPSSPVVDRPQRYGRRPPAAPGAEAGAGVDHPSISKPLFLQAISLTTDPWHRRDPADPTSCSQRPIQPPSTTRVSPCM